MPPGGGVLARLLGPGVGVLNSFLPGGGDIRPSKKLPRGFARGGGGGGGDGQAWN